MTTRQSILRSSMPAFSAVAAAKQVSKPTFETGAAAIKLGGKNGTKIGNGEPDLAALLAEVCLFEGPLIIQTLHNSYSLILLIICISSGGFCKYGFQPSGIKDLKLHIFSAVQHNRKFRPKPTYEPRIHSVKDIREVINGLPSLQLRFWNALLRRVREIRHSGLYFVMLLNILLCFEVIRLVVKNPFPNDVVLLYAVGS